MQTETHTTPPVPELVKGTPWTEQGITVGRWVTVQEQNVSWYGAISYLNWDAETVTLYTGIGGHKTLIKIKMADTISIKINWLK